MAKINVEVVGAYVDGKAPGSTLSIEEKSANHLKSLGYVKIKPKQTNTSRKKAVTTNK